MRRAPRLEPATAGRPDPAAVGAACLAPVRRAGVWAGLVLALLAGCAPACTGDPRAALLPGVPAVLLLLTHRLGRPLPARRVASVATTSIAGFAVLATLPSLAALDQLSGEHAWAVGLQLACLLVGAVVLLCAWPAWRAFHSEAGAADATRRAFEEL
jgi:hypothetical protein